MQLTDVTRAWNVPPDLAEGRLDKPWKGTAAHMKIDPEVSRMLWGLTGAAVELLHAGAILWVFERLRKDPAVAPLGHLAQALFARQASPLYLRPLEQYRWFPLTDGASLAGGATAVLAHLVLKDACEEPHQRALDSVLYPANLSIGIARFVMPARSRAFGGWLASAVEVLRRRAALPGPVAPPAKSVSRKIQQELIAANTKAPYAPLALHTRLSVGITVSGVEYGSPEAVEQGRLAFGAPLSPFILSPDGAAKAPGLDAVLAGLEPEKNPFLYSAKELRALGDKTPYRFAAR